MNIQRYVPSERKQRDIEFGRLHAKNSKGRLLNQDAQNPKEMKEKELDMFETLINKLPVRMDDQASPRSSRTGVFP